MALSAKKNETLLESYNVIKPEIKCETAQEIMIFFFKIGPRNNIQATAFERRFPKKKLEALKKVFVIFSFANSCKLQKSFRNLFLLKTRKTIVKETLENRENSSREFFEKRRRGKLTFGAQRIMGNEKLITKIHFKKGILKIL